MALGDIMERWFNHDINAEHDEPGKETIKEFIDSPPSEREYSPDLTEPFDMHTFDKTENDLDVKMPQMEKYRQCILENSAYEWLLGDLRRHFTLTPSNPDVMTEIRKTILNNLPSQPRFSRRESPLLYKMKYSLNWDLVSFLKGQNYGEETSKAFSLVITVTGSRDAAQALTCSEYLRQTWPMSAGGVLELFEVLLKVGINERANGMKLFLPKDVFMTLTGIWNSSYFT